MFVNIKKILVLFICLIFSNTSFAIPGWLGFSSDQARCKVNYTRLNLITGIETVKKHTTQHDDDYDDSDYNNDIGISNLNYNCTMAVGKLYEKINKWQEKSRTNIVANMTVMYCKSRSKDGIFSNEWSSYKQCDIVSSQSVAINTAAHYPGQIGYNAHECRLLETTQENINNSPFCR
jgi:hypothetical protein